MRSFALDAEAIQALAKRPLAWRELLDLEPEHEPNFILLPNPFRCPAAELVASLDKAFPDRPKIGGMASGGREASSVALLLRQGLEEAAVVGLALWGDIQVETAEGQRLVNARFTGIDAENRPFSITADSVRQEGEEDKGQFELDRVSSSCRGWNSIGLWISA